MKDASRISSAEFSAFRSDMLGIIRSEILGPVQENEIISVSPRRRYVVGQLSPAGNRLELPDDPELSSAEIDPKGIEATETSGQPDADVQHRTAVSSIGLTFICAYGSALVADVSWGEYNRVGSPIAPDATSANLTGNLSSTPAEEFWQRTPRQDRRQLPLITAQPISERVPLSSRAALHIEARSEGQHAVISVFLINESSQVSDGCDIRLYQPKIRLTPVDPALRPFLSRDLIERRNSRSTYNAEELGIELLYRDRKEFAVGRHVAVFAANISSDGASAGVVETDVVPAFELRVNAPRKELGTGDILRQSTIADQSDKFELARLLDSAFDTYDAWLSEQTHAASALPQHLTDVASMRLAACGQRLKRIREGIAVLRNNVDAFESFRVMNEAMARVRFRQKLLRPESSRSGDLFDPAGRDGVWYPFQLGFILSVLPELSSPEEHPDFRNTVDVLFFPTGGGKTEAYLGAMAFSALYRRRKSSGAGVSSILRYTYRLLSTQQFSRAATLICALEAIRKEALSGTARCGEWLNKAAPFSIGLWIGGDHTPNLFIKAKQAIIDYKRWHTSCTKAECDVVNVAIKDSIPADKPSRANDLTTTASPLVLPVCPWCGAQLCIADVHANEVTARTSFICPDKRCLFSSDKRGDEENFAQRLGLPVVTVDEEIFKACPTVIVGTADKFATLWYRPTARALFGKVSGYCERHGYITPSDGAHKHVGTLAAVTIEELPPIDLFVQDELHLINEALGSAYGFVECAVDELAKRGNIVPKKIAATATIRRSQEQIKALYDRPSSVFPLAPIDAGDSFFALEQEPTAISPGRLYVGLYAPSQSRLYALDQIIAAQLDAAHRLIDDSKFDLADPYRTLVIYCNTLRDLGQIQGLLADDIPKHLRMIARLRSGVERILRDVKSELTGKTPQTELRETMRKLASTYVNEEADGRFGCDAVCATSMLSVGIDIDRLGVMLVDGQPKSTSEYIQATSRIGRSSPGLVLTTYNPQRPRDLSHYEHFYSYHGALYKHVETPSVTPSSFGTIDKYLENVFIALYRLDTGYRPDDSAIPFSEHMTAVRQTCDAIIYRLTQIGSSFEEQHVSKSIETLVSQWSSAAQTGSLEYSYPSAVFNRQQQEKVRQNHYVARMDQPSKKPSNVLFEAPMSLRNVEPELEMFLGS